MVAGPLLILGLTASLVVRASLAETLRQRLEEHALTVARSVGTHQVDALAGGADVLSPQMIEAMVSSDPEVVYAGVYRADGRLLSQASRPGAPPDRLQDGPPQPDLGPESRRIETSAGMIYEATLPLQGNPGYIRVGLTDAGAKAAIAATGRTLAVITAGALIVAVAVSLGLSQLIVFPILALQRAVRTTSLTNLPGRTEPRMDDEIGELTRAFNTMAADLARSRDSLLAQNRELAVLNATAQAISGSLDLESLLRAALDEIRQQMHLQAAWIFLAAPHPFSHWLEPTGNGNAPTEVDRPLQLVVHTGLGEAFAAEEAGRDFAGCDCLDVLSSGECRIVSDLAGGCTRLSREVVLAEGLIAHASIPLVARDRVVGVLVVAANTARAFRDEEMQLLRSIGQQVGVAVDNAWLWDQVRRKEQRRGQLLERILSAQEKERRRIALELHDQTGSSLASLSVGLRVLEDSTPLPRAARNQLRDLKDQVSQIAGDLHRLALDLRPPTLDRLGLAEAIEQSVNDFARQHGLATDFQAIGLETERLPADVETALYRIVQEALTNIARHAQASDVGVVLERRLDSVVVVIEDNGQGFEVAQALAADESHLGLFGMQEHATLVGGRWQVESAVGQGATIFVEVPIHGRPAVVEDAEGEGR
jgi:signal transduction histidine kinase/HAMP domain-containing protein